MKKIFILILVGVLLPFLAFAFTFYEGNPACCDLGYCEYELLIDAPVSGNYNDGVLFVNLVVIEEKCFNWSSNIPVDAVIVKGGPAGVNLYEYDPASTGDENLCAPDTFAISRIRFCYSIEEPPNNEDEGILTIPETFPADTLAYANDFFTDLNLIVVLSAGLPVAFWGIKKVIALVRLR